MMDFTNCKRIITKAYNGANGKKIAIEYNGNWGFLYHNASDESEIAPVFDCGSCLLPQADEKIMEKY